MAIENEEDGEFIQMLFLENKQAMFRMAMKITKNEHTAWDMVLATCVAMIDHIGKLREIISCKRASYIISMVKNTSLMYLRKRRRENTWLVADEKVFDWATHEHHDVDEDLIAEAEIGELREALNRIHKNHRELLEMKYFANMSDEEIASQLGIGKDSVRFYLTKARRSLKEALKGSD